MKDRLAFAVFLVSLTLLAFLAGVFVVVRNLPPAETLIGIHNDAVDLWDNWQNDWGVEPTRLLVAAPEGREPGVAVLDPDRTADGLRLISELTPHRQALAGLRLIDREGTELHYWPVDYARLAPGGRSPNNVFLHGVEPFEDGSIVVNFDNGEVIARVDACGNPLWITDGNFHHVVTRTVRGTLWAWEAIEDPADPDRNNHYEYMVELDAETGRELRRVSLEHDVITPHALYGRFALHTLESEERVDYCCDAFHPNDVEELPPALAPAFPMFAAGDLLLSFRSLNMIAVIDPADGRLKWARIGPWFRQHDPDFLPDGTISVYDNRMGAGSSVIRRADPATDRVWTTFEADPPEGFYSYRRGMHETLPNGNLLVVETERGRVLEVTPDGRTVWTYSNVYDDERNGLVSDARLLPDDFFTDGIPRCEAG